MLESLASDRLNARYRSRDGAHFLRRQFIHNRSMGKFVNLTGAISWSGATLTYQERDPNPTIWQPRINARFPPQPFVLCSTFRSSLCNCPAPEIPSFWVPGIFQSRWPKREPRSSNLFARRSSCFLPSFLLHIVRTVLTSPRSTTSSINLRPQLSRPPLSRSQRSH
jgi:hypothetical protein